MKVTYDPASKRVVVAFRGRITVLPESYESEATGVNAGEAHCQRLGWNPEQAKVAGKKFFRSMF